MLHESPITNVNQLTPYYLTKQLQAQNILTSGAVQAVHRRNRQETRISIWHYLEIVYTQHAAGNNLPKNLFLKLSQPEFFEDDREVVFYDQLVPKMTQDWSGAWPFVRCLDAAYSADTGCSYLLLDDVSETHYVLPNKKMLPSQNICSLLIDAYAGFHAFWWEHPLLGQEVGSLLTEEIISDTEAKAKLNIARLLEAHPSLLPPDEAGILRQVISHWPQRRRERVLQGRGVTVVHRDPHPGNILYPHQPNIHSLKLIDWQSWRIDTGTDDLAYLMAFHWPATNRVRLERPLLRRYHNQLQTKGVPDYSWADCVYDYRASIIRFLFVMVLYWQHEVNRKRLMRGLRAYMDWNCEEIL